MEILTKLLVAACGLGAGVLMLRYSRQVVRFTGHFGWAERYLGHGGTHTAIRLFAGLLIFVFVLYPFGYWDAWLKDGKKPSMPGLGTSQSAASATDPGGK